MAEKERKLRLGVAVLVTDNNNNLLLGKRGKLPNYGTWIIPGGGVVEGETWRKTARRELFEETRLGIEIEETNRPYIHEIITDDEHRVILYVRATVVDGQLEAGSDLLEVRFFAKSDIPIDKVSPAVIPVLKAFGWI